MVTICTKTYDTKFYNIWSLLNLAAAIPAKNFQQLPILFGLNISEVPYTNVYPARIWFNTASLKKSGGFFAKQAKSLLRGVCFYRGWWQDEHPHVKFQPSFVCGTLFWCCNPANEKLKEEEDSAKPQLLDIRYFSNFRKHYQFQREQERYRRSCHLPLLQLVEQRAGPVHGLQSKMAF